MPVFERLSKTAAATSVLVIVCLLLAVHPAMTWLLRGMGLAALAAGLLATRPEGVHTAWVIAAMIAPAFLRLLSGREGEVLDVVWMAGLAGALLRTVSWSRWTLPVAWRILLGGWVLALSLAWPILVGRELGFALEGFDDIGAINSWAMRSAPVIAGWILHVVLTQLLGVLWLDWLHGTIAARPARLPRVVHGLWIGATAASVVAIVQGTIDIGFLSTPFWAAERRATGTMLDANVFGVCAAIAAPVGLLAVRALRPRSSVLAATVLAINWVGVWMSGSRTGLLCAAAGALALGAGLWLSRRRSWKPLVAAAVVAFVILGVAAGAVGPLRRLIDVAGGLRASDLWTRGGYGTVAVQMAREHPLTGVGVGSYHFLAPDYWRAVTNDSLAWDNAQNWWRHTLAELGLFGGLPVLLWSVLIAWRIVTGRARPNQIVRTATVRGLLIGIGIISLLGMPTQSPVVLLWFFLLAAWLNVLLPEPETPGPPPRWARAGWMAAVALAVAYVAGHIGLAVGPLSVAERAQRSHREYVVGAYPPEPLPGSNEFRWTDDESRFVWPVRTRWLAIRVWAQHPDIGQSPVRVTISTPCGVLFEEALASSTSVSIGTILPEGLQAVDVTVRASRTWQPSAFGGEDERHLGAAVVGDFLPNETEALSQMRTRPWPPCRPAS